MTDLDLVAQLAKEAGFEWDDACNICHAGLGTFERFAALVAEECATLAENTYEGDDGGVSGCSGFSFYGENSADAIRKRFIPEEAP